MQDWLLSNPAFDHGHRARVSNGALGRIRTLMTKLGMLPPRRDEEIIAINQAIVNELIVSDERRKVINRNELPDTYVLLASVVAGFKYL